MICECCNEPIVEYYGSGRFCDRVCARRFSTKAKRSEINSRVSKKAKVNSHEKTKHLRDPGVRQKRKDTILARYGTEDTFRLTDLSKANIASRLEERKKYISNLPFDSLTRHQKYKRLREQYNYCTICGLFEWQGLSIPLEIDHINGIRTDESESNLRVICCNCHAQTPTYKSKNRKILR
jgi:hypothetical protein